MYVDHPRFDIPEDNTILWKYMDFAKLMSVLAGEALFFTRLDKFTDPFEGAPSQANLKKYPDIYQEEYDDNFRKGVERLYKTTAQDIFANCWCESEYESVALWEQYARGHYGIAIRTDFQSLKSCFLGSENVYIGRVKYIDYYKEYMPDTNPFYAALHKRKNYEQEKEVRVMIKPIRSDIDKPVDESGLYYKINVNSLIRKIVVTYESQDWFPKVVKALTLKYDLSVPVVKSTIATQPSWG